MAVVDGHSGHLVLPCLVAGDNGGDDVGHLTVWPRAYNGDEAVPLDGGVDLLLAAGKFCASVNDGGLVRRRVGLVDIAEERRQGLPRGRVVVGA